MIMKKHNFLLFLSVVPAACLMTVSAEGSGAQSPGSLGEYDMDTIRNSSDRFANEAREEFNEYANSSKGTSTVRKLDLSLYQQGADIFLGDVDISEGVISDKLWKIQNRVISGYKKRLPRTVSAILDLKNLEGRLEKEQFKALKYFLHARYLNRNRSFSG